MKTKIRLKILAFCIIAFFSFLIFKAVQSSLVYYQTVSEVLMNDDSINSFRQLRVMGTVKDNSIVFNSDGSIEFKIEDFNKVTEIKDSILNYNRLNPNLNFENFIIYE